MKIRSTKITGSAKWQDCNIRIPGVCNRNPETTVFAHIGNINKGTGTKASDLHGTYACSACHDALDGRVKTEFNRHELQVFAYQGMLRTLDQLVEADIVQVPSGRKVA